MKTSTKNTIIAGIFTIIASIIGIISYSIGGNVQSNKIEDAFKQSGIISDDQEESLIETINKLSDNYIEINNQLNLLSKKNSELVIENNNLKSNNELLDSKIDSLQNELENALKENEKLKTQVSENNKLSDDQKDKESPNDEKNYTNTLNNIYKIDSCDYELIKGFTDSYGNTYSLAYKFDASKNAYAIFNLNRQYSILTGYATASQDTGSNAVMTIEIYGDDVLLKKIDNITKSSDAIPLEDINVSGIKKLTINTYNSGAYYCGFSYLTDVKLK